MSNWITNCLTLHGDTNIIADIVNSHFQIEPPNEDPDILENICNFPDLVAAPSDEKVRQTFGFHTVLGTTAENVNAFPPAQWDGTITNPFFIFWCSKWVPVGDVPLALIARYPHVAVEYEWHDTVNDSGQHCESEDETLFVQEQWGMKAAEETQQGDAGITENEH